MKLIRIKGLVSLMNRTRKQLANGIPTSEVKAFKGMVLDTITFVEEFCWENDVPLSDLPGPTRRAYEYLKRIDLDNLPVRRECDAETVSSLRISGMIATCREIQFEFSRLARAQLAGRNEEEDLEQRLSALHQHITELAAMVDEICEKVDATPDLLPDPTRRAYQWLTFLSDLENFKDHFQTLINFCRGIPDAYVELYNLAGLYRIQTKKGVHRITIHEAFVHAPRPVIKDLAAAVISPKERAHKLRIKRYADTEEFREAILGIEMIGIQLEEKTLGEVYDLEEVFTRVNDRYFQGRMERPILTWNKIITSNKFGHYIPAADTLMISIALDRRDVPTYVIDQVMHHELLHKKLGTKVINGRTIAHTPEFRALEKSYKHYHEAQAFLAKLSRNH
jgi:hypothetical protein